MLLKKTSSSWSLSKSAAMTVRTGDGMENLGVAMSCGGDGHGVTMGMVSGTPGPTLVLRVLSSLGTGAQSQIRVKPATHPPSRRGSVAKPAVGVGGGGVSQPSPGIGHAQGPRFAGRGGAAHSSCRRQCPPGHRG